MFFFVSLGIFAIFHIFGFYAFIKPLSAQMSLKAKIFLAFIGLLNFCFVVLYMFSRRVEWLPNIVVIAFSLSILFGLLLFFAGFLNIFSLIFLKKFPRLQLNIMKILGVFIIIGIAFGAFSAHKMPRVKPQEIYVENLRRDFSILLISDLHLSKLISAQKVRDIVALANAQNPDIIVLAGDIIDAPEDSILEHLDALRSLNARFGVYYALGNHEYIFGAESSARIIGNLDNIELLLNENTAIDETINLIGISDVSGMRLNHLAPDLARASRDLRDLPSVLISHQPKIIELEEFSAVAPKIDLVLSGHTHGGQVFPFSFFVYLGNPFLYGLKNFGDTQVFITQGASVAVTYARLGTQNEMNLITLKNKI